MALYYMHSMWYYYSQHHRWSGVDHLWVRHLEVMWITTQRDVTLSTHIDSCTIWYAIGVGECTTREGLLRRAVATCTLIGTTVAMPSTTTTEIIMGVVMGLASGPDALPGISHPRISHPWVSHPRGHDLRRCMSAVSRHAW